MVDVGGKCHKEAVRSILERCTLPVQPSELSPLSEVGSGVPLSFPLSRSSESVGNNTRAADGVTGVTGVAILIKTRPDTIKSTHDSKSQRASAWRTVSSQLHGNARWKAAGIAPSPQILPAAPRCPHSSPAPRLPLCSLCRAAPSPSACAGCREHMGTGRQGS